jgi:hypothetical protein
MHDRPPCPARRIRNEICGDMIVIVRLWQPGKIVDDRASRCRREY